MTRQTLRPDSDGRVMSNGHFSKALVALMQWTGRSPTQVAGITGRSAAAVSQWLHKGDIPSLDVIFLIEDDFGVRRGLLARYVEPSLKTPITEPTPEQKIIEGLLEEKLTDTQRKLVLEMLAQCREFNRSTGLEPPPALPEP